MEKYVALKKTAPEDSEELQQVKMAVKRLFDKTADMWLAKNAVQTMLEGVFRKTLLHKKKELEEATKGYSTQIARLLDDITPIGKTSECHVEYDCEKLKREKIYIRMINASSVSRLLPITGKILDEDRLLDLLESKMFVNSVDCASQLKDGKKYEEAALKNLISAFGNGVTTCGTFVNLQFPLISATPDAVLKREGKIIAPIEIKVLTKPNHDNIFDDLCRLHRASELGIKANPNSKGLLIRRGSAVFQQLQSQLFTIGTAYGYLAIYNPFTGAMMTSRITRDDRFINNIKDRASINFSNIYETADTLLATANNNTDNFLVSNEDLLPLGGWLHELRQILSIGAPETEDNTSTHEEDSLKQHLHDISQYHSNSKQGDDPWELT